MGFLKWVLTACFVLAMMVLGLKAEPKKDTPNKPSDQATAAINILNF